MASDWAKAAVNQPSANHVGKAVERIIEREAAMGMPERISVWRDDPDIAWGGWSAGRGEPTDTEYVLATTHQRTLEALREAEKAFSRIVDGREVRDQMAPETTRVESLPRDEIEAICEAALARIKEANP